MTDKLYACGSIESDGHPRYYVLTDENFKVIGAWNSDFYHDRGCNEGQDIRKSDLWTKYFKKQKKIKIAP